MRRVLIKCGGSVIDSLTPEFFSSLQKLISQNYQLIFVHGGGPDINEMLNLYHVKPEFHNGLRKTTEQTMKVVEMVLSGHTNRKLVHLLEVHGLNAFGLNGSDGKCLQAKYINKEQLGLVGEIEAVNQEVILMLLRENIITVITPIGISKTGEKLNVNADHAAAAVARELNCHYCLFVTDVDGIYIDGNLVSNVSEEDIHTYITEGKITGGMIPKVKSALAAIEKGLERVMIVSGKKAFFDGRNWMGTKIQGKAGILQ
ncbi:acetylglutamate kinase [Bacillus methanolicus]|uniref:Acetylglutamate kinase n=1 Tax=Bacillus methanolicus (strain MGA3 / ATCC 53907) TaxID=796606 RepID=I3E7N1_BACMM|nr:acetylglutamate kinase [Bacillus methanolicus]AIE59326.1 Acetylglutamate kinase [Bacillus methanolicus MGA3]EIJ82502.1 acetylglutamate kinase [Bacillus methanolicus MGA3]